MRIVSLLPSATEILFAIGAGERVVGVTHECDFPVAARALPVLTSSLLPAHLQTQLGAAVPAVGQAAAIDRHVRASVHSGSSLYALDADLLATLAPDVIITQELCKVCAVSYDTVARAAKRIRADGGPSVISLEPSSLEDVYANILTVGELVGAESGAQALIAQLRAREAALRGARTTARAVRTLVLEWTDPPMSGGHWTPGLVELAGGEPLLSHPGANSQSLTWEAIAAADPAILIMAPCGYDLPHARAAAAQLEDHPVYRELRAVRAGQAYVMDGNAYVNRPGPRLLDTAEIFAGIIAGNLTPSEAIEQLNFRLPAR